MDNTYIKKQKQLGMLYGNAWNLLRKRILFKLVKDTGQDTCFRCGKQILTDDEFSIDHKIDWIDVDPALFWDLDNISFSHLKCNRPSRFHGRVPVLVEGKKWCGKCQEYVLIENFNKDKSSPDGLFWYCKKCRSDYRKDRRSMLIRK